MTVLHGYQKFMSYHLKVLGKEGFDRYRCWLQPFLEYLRLHDRYDLDPAVLDLNKLRIQDLWLYVHWLRSCGYRPSTVRTYQAALKSMLSWLQENGCLSEDLDLRTFVPVAVSSAVKCLSAEQIDQIDRSFYPWQVLDRRDFIILHLMMDLGLSVHEISFLTVSDVDLDAGCLQVMRSHCQISLRIPDCLLDVMLLYDHSVGSRIWFLVTRSGRQLGYEVVKKVCQRRYDLTGIRLTPSLLLDTYKEGINRDAATGIKGISVDEAPAWSAEADGCIV